MAHFVSPPPYQKSRFGQTNLLSYFQALCKSAWKSFPHLPISLPVCFIQIISSENKHWQEIIKKLLYVKATVFIILENIQNIADFPRSDYSYSKEAE